MSETYSREEISQAVNTGADLVLMEFDLGDRDTDLLALVINAALTVLDVPEATMNDVVESCYGESLDDIRGWWDFS
ncbi:hypothetical protein ACTWP5_18815 [Streptomyces sp. 4N509B]|uniref:hypothetical protein n=1 Tax=Streptomyces sp. 4N509B TaxID=3457413 RepID=UPI003FD5C173